MTAISTSDDKSRWDILGSSIYYQTGVHHDYFAIDGILQPPANLANAFSSLEVDHPWFRIHLGAERLIKGARILVRSGKASRLAFTEVLKPTKRQEDNLLKIKLVITGKSGQ